MNSKEFADQIEAMLQSIRHRIEGVGADQYDEGAKQKIESLTYVQLIDEALAEVDDLLVYSAYLRIRLANLRKLFPRESP